MWFTLAPVDLAYVSTAPRHVCRDIVLDVSAPGAFEVLTGDRWLEWFPELRAIQWNPPRAVGGTRYVRLGRAEAHETAAKGVIHKNQAANRKSKLMRRIAKASASA